MRFKPLALSLVLAAPFAVGCAAGPRLGLGGPAHIASLEPGGAAAQGGGPRLRVGQDDAAVARVTARVLAEKHFARRPLDDALSSKLLDRYIDFWDPRRLYFTQEDMTEFDQWRTKLDDLIRQKGDTSPANAIFARFLERFDQQTAFATEALKSDKFTFETDEEYDFERKNAARPKDLTEAKKVWRDRLRFEYLQEKLNGKKPELIAADLTKRYARTSRTLHEYDGGDVFEQFMNVLMHAYDPHSAYFGPVANETFNIQMRLSLFGIGAELLMEDGYAKVMRLMPGGPAIKSNKLKVGDRIVAVAQGEGEFVDARDMKIDKVVEMVRGPKGTRVRLNIWPADAPDPSTRREVVLVRDQIKLEESEAKAQIIEMTGADGKARRVGVIDLPAFYTDFGSTARNRKSSTRDVYRLLQKLRAEGIEGLILDLRRNGGGSLEEAINLTGLFIGSGPVVQVKDYDGDKVVREDENPGVAWDGPMLVLTSRGSASASEILAGALQDYGRAAVVGDAATFGKGTVQQVYSLAEIMGRQVKADPGAISLTVQQFYRPGGKSTQLNGVAADIVLPSLTDSEEIGERSLEGPLPFDTIEAASFPKLNLIAPHLPELKKRSQARTTTDSDFAFLNRQLARYKKLQARKTVSLNEAKRRAEKAEADTIVAARRKDLAGRKPSGEKVYAITLANVDAPGLPAPLKPGKAPGPRPDPAAADDDAPGEAAANLPSLDSGLEEAKRILRDLISLSGSPASVARKK